MPVEKVIRKRVRNCGGVTFSNNEVWLLKRINQNANTGARKNRNAVPVTNETLFSTYLLTAVDDPHMSPASNANNPAIVVPEPVEKFT